jgi:hypothetical protein
MNGPEVNPATSQNCTRCGARLPAGALAGFCPACLLQQGAVPDTLSGPAAHPFEPPPVAELAPLFPQLEILALLGKGGMGAVYKARQKQLDRWIALKILPPAAGEDPAFAERFTREARALAQLNHPGIVTLYEFGCVQNRLYYFLMEFVDGVNLRQLLAAGRISAREALAVSDVAAPGLVCWQPDGAVLWRAANPAPDRAKPFPAAPSLVLALRVGRTLRTLRLDLARINEFRLQLSPWQWVEVQNVSLRPGVRTEVRVVQPGKVDPRRTSSR